MKLIVCIDDDNGMLFNKRRQSSDSAVIKRISELSRGVVLWTNEYSAGLFSQYEGTLAIDGGFLQKAGAGEFCFAENADVSQAATDCEQLIIYRWNRKYPSDVKFPLQSALCGRELISAFEFSGSSHEKITEEVYE